MIVAAGGGYFARRNIAEGKIGKAEEVSAQIVENARKEADAKKKEVLLEAKEEIHRLRSEMEREK